MNGVLRVWSGNHYPSDVIAGAAVGSFIGWLVPRMHKGKESRYRCELAANEEDIPILSVIFSYIC